ncbi:MAG TPA: Hsp20/alpha crystallin family protein [Anaerolineae bacterium]|nr:Hsp20/alpha crystallin family protein [Anaerolineae bacterium]
MEEHLLDDIERIHVEMERLFEEVISSGRWPSMRRTRTWRPPTDVYETDTCVVVKVEIAGMREEDFDISLSSRVLTIAGVRRDPTAEAHGSTLSYQQMEIRYGDFRTEVYIPWAIVEDEIEATYEDGFLKVVLPKARAQKVRIVR